MSYQGSEPGAGFDFTKLPKVSHDVYELPEGRKGWTFQGLGRIGIFSYIAALVLSIVLLGATSTEATVAVLMRLTAIGIGFVPIILGIVGLFFKVGRWWALVTLLAGVILFPFFMAWIFISFSYIVMF